MSTVKRVLTALSLLMMTGTHAAHAEDVRQEWIRESSADRLAGRVVRVDSSGNIHVLSTSGGAYAVKKYDTSGNVLWGQTYGGDQGRICSTRAMVVDAPGNVYVTGECRDAQYHFAAVTLKFDAGGSLLWTARYDEPSSSAFAAALVVDESGDATLAGFRENAATGMDYLTIRYDASGNQRWVSLYDAGPYTDPGRGNVRSNDYAGAVALDGQGNAFVTGTIRVHPANYSATQYATVKYDSLGRQLWVRTQNALGEREGGTRVAADRDGNAYVVGTKLIKYDPYGNELWTKTYGAVACFFPGDAAITPSGNIVVTGSGSDESCIFDGPVWRTYVFQYFTGQYDPNGNLLWGARYSKTYSSDNRATSLVLDGRGNAYVTGFSQAGGASAWNAVTLKYDPYGRELWSVRTEGASGEYGTFASSLAVDKRGNVYIVGKRWKNNSWPGTVLIKYSQPSLNQPPAANAGPDQTVEMTSCAGAAVTLDGSASSDPDGDALTYTWTWSGGSASGVSPSITLPYGATTVTLAVDDGKGGTSTDTVVINVVDATPPFLNVTLSPSMLWPPNHKYVKVTPSITIADACAATTTVTLVSAMSSEPDNGLGDGDTANDIVINSDGTLSLRAERSGTGSGRVYTIMYQATDIAGNSATATATVTVPHNK